MTTLSSATGCQSNQSEFISSTESEIVSVPVPYRCSECIVYVLWNHKASLPSSAYISLLAVITDSPKTPTNSSVEVKPRVPAVAQNSTPHTVSPLDDTLTGGSSTPIATVTDTPEDAQTVKKVRPPTVDASPVLPDSSPQLHTSIASLVLTPVATSPARVVSKTMSTVTATVEEKEETMDEELMDTPEKAAREVETAAVMPEKVQTEDSKDTQTADSIKTENLEMETESAEKISESENVDALNAEKETLSDKTTSTMPSVEAESISGDAAPELVEQPVTEVIEIAAGSTLPPVVAEPEPTRSTRTKVLQKKSEPREPVPIAMEPTQATEKPMEPTEPPVRSTRTKVIQKPTSVTGNEDGGEPVRSTRTKVIRKQEEEGAAKTEGPVVEEGQRSTRTKVVQKSASVSEPPTEPTRSTRTKTRQAASESDAEPEKSAAPARITRLVTCCTICGF